MINDDKKKGRPTARLDFTAQRRALAPIVREIAQIKESDRIDDRFEQLKKVWLAASKKERAKFTAWLKEQE